MERRPEISLTSYDRFFPNQDTMPERGFGNLIALPLQRRPKMQGNTLVLVHRRQLMDQWIRRLNEFLKPQSGMIGHIGAGKKSESGLIDVAILQSLIHEADL
jgi:superfamily II DNA or RNA helicase